MSKFFSDILHGKAFQGDKGVWMIYFFLCMISLVEVYSASSRLTFDSTNHWGPMISQAGFLAAGTFLILVIHRIPCKWFMLIPPILFPVTLFLMVITVLGHGGGELNGTNRWMRIFGISFQPSEFAKVALIMTSAVVLAKCQAEKVITKRGKQRIIVGAIKGTEHRAFGIVTGLSAVICGLIFLDNVSTACMLFLVIVLMMFIAHVPNHLLMKGGVVLGIIAIGYLFTFMALPQDSRKHMPGSKRISTVLARFDRHSESSQRSDSEASKDEIHTLLNDKNSQTTYAFIAVANSNVIGKGPGNSIERDFLQHAESDFIYAIIVEELGIFGGSFILFLYLALLIRCGRIAQKCRRFFPAYLVLGLGLMMVLQALVNMGVAVGLLPVTGQTLPLISKGGTSILLTCFNFGLILSISRYAASPEPEKAPIQPVETQGETTEYMTEGAMA